jgi:type IV secretory pathway VirB10-like protein
MNFVKGGVLFMKKIFTIFIALVFVSSFTLSIAGCKKAEEAATKAKETSKEAVKEVKDATKEAATKVTEATKETVKEAKDAAKDAATKAKEATKETVKEVKDATKEAATKAKEATK